MHYNGITRRTLGRKLFTTRSNEKILSIITEFYFVLKSPIFLALLFKQISKTKSCFMIDTTLY